MLVVPSLSRKINLELPNKKGGLVQMIFLFNWVILRFPFNSGPETKKSPLKINALENGAPFLLKESLFSGTNCWFWGGSKCDYNR